MFNLLIDEFSDLRPFKFLWAMCSKVKKLFNLWHPYCWLEAFAINYIMEQVKPSYYVSFIKLKEIVNDVVPIHDVASKNKDAIDSQYFIFLNLKNINI